MKKTLGLYVFGLTSAALAAALPSLPWISLIAFLIIMPVGALWIRRGRGYLLGDLGFSRSRRWLGYLTIGLVTGVGIPVLFVLIQQLAGWITLSQRGEPISGLLSSLPQVLIRMIVVVAIEEFVFRGFFTNALTKRTRIWAAIVLSSLLWGASHLGSMAQEGLSLTATAIAMISFLAWGISLSMAYLIANRSLWLPYGVHLGVNLGFSLLGWYFVSQPNAPQWWIGHPSWSPESGLIGSLVWVIVALVTYWLARPISEAEQGEA